MESVIESKCPVEERSEGNVEFDRWRLGRHALRHMNPGARTVCRLILRVFGGQIKAIHGWKHVIDAGDRFILALNHSQKREAILIPAALAALRHGRQIHFAADWNFLMIPVIGSIIRLNDPIIVDRKNARPRILNYFKPYLTCGIPVMEQARQRLRQGRAIGFFPEGTVNRHPGRLLRGYRGVARLSLEENVPVIPGGVRFPEHAPDEPITEQARLEIHFANALRPDVNRTLGADSIRAWHAEIMSAIAKLSGKQWSPKNSRIKHVP